MHVKSTNNNDAITRFINEEAKKRKQLKFQQAKPPERLFGVVIDEDEENSCNFNNCDKLQPTN